MSTLKDLRTKAKEQGLRGYSTMNREQLEQLLKGEKVVKYSKKQRHAETQTEDLPQCHDCEEILACHVCGLNRAFEQLQHNQRKIVYDGDLTFDADTGELLEPEVSGTREGVFMNKRR